MTGATPARQTDRQADRADGQTEATSPTDTWKSWVNRFASATRCVSRVSTSTPFRTRLPGQALGQCQCPNHFVINYACAMLPPKIKKPKNKKPSLDTAYDIIAADRGSEPRLTLVPFADFCMMHAKVAICHTQTGRNNLLGEHSYRWWRWPLAQKQKKQTRRKKRTRTEGDFWRKV